MRVNSDEQGHDSPGGWLRKARIDRGLTPEALAAAVGTTRGTVDRWEKDLSRVQRRWHRELAATLGVPLAELVTTLGLTAASNVVQLRGTQEVESEGKVHVAPYTPDQRRALDAAFTGLEMGHATNPSWVAAMTATAKVVGLPWELGDAKD